MILMTDLLAFGFPSGPEWILILIIVLLLFGAKKLPELARGLGLGIKEFKKASKEITDEVTKPDDDSKKDGDKPKDGNNSNPG